MSEKPLGLRERNRIRTRDEILIAMSTLLGEQQYESITVDDVAQLAGVSRGTIYTYFADGRVQLLREAYLRVAEMVIADAEAERQLHRLFTHRVVALATAVNRVASTPEGRFYGLSGPNSIGPLEEIAGRASGVFEQMMIEDLEDLRSSGGISPKAPVKEISLLLVGAIRQIGIASAQNPNRVNKLLEALRLFCDSVQTPQSTQD